LAKSGYICPFNQKTVRLLKEFIQLVSNEKYNRIALIKNNGRALFTIKQIFSNGKSENADDKENAEDKENSEDKENAEDNKDPIELNESWNDPEEAEIMLKILAECAFASENDHKENERLFEYCSKVIESGKGHLDSNIAWLISRIGARKEVSGSSLTRLLRAVNSSSIEIEQPKISQLLMPIFPQILKTFNYQRSHTKLTGSSFSKSTYIQKGNMGESKLSPLNQLKQARQSVNFIVSIDNLVGQFENIETLPPHFLSDFGFLFCPANTQNNMTVQRVRALPFSDDYDRFFKCQSLTLGESSGNDQMNLSGMFDGKVSKDFFDDFRVGFGEARNQEILSPVANTQTKKTITAQVFDTIPSDLFLPTIDDVDELFLKIQN